MNQPQQRKEDATQEAHVESMKRPVAKGRVGNVQYALWDNKTDTGGDFYKTTFELSYKEGEMWKTSTSYGPNERLQLSKAADLAHTEIVKLQAQARAIVRAAQS